MKPLTVALDILQGDECTYGTLLPTLTSLMSKTLALKDDLSRMTASLPDAIVKVLVFFIPIYYTIHGGQMLGFLCFNPLAPDAA